MIQYPASIAVRPPEDVYFQKDRDTLEKRSSRWLKELASKSQITGFDPSALAIQALERWLPPASGEQWKKGRLMSTRPNCCCIELI